MFLFVLSDKNWRRLKTYLFSITFIYSFISVAAVLLTF